MSSRCTHKGHKPDKMDTGSEHELNLGEDLRQFFNMQKNLSTLPKFLPNSEKLSQRSHDGLGYTHKWPNLFPISPDVANFLNRVSITTENWDSVTRAFTKSEQAY